MTQKTTFVLTLSEQYQLKCSFVDSQQKETIIKLQNQDNDFYPINISFANNKIEVCKQQENTTEFIEEWFTQPQVFKTYSIEYQGKEYTPIAEVFFALIVNEFKQQIEKEYIIEETKIELPVQNKVLNSRLLTSLDAIGLKEISLEDEEVDYDYSQQGNILQELLEKKEEYEKRERKIERANQIKQIEIDTNCLISEELFEKEIKKYSTKERTQIKLCNLDNYCIFIASRYLNTIEDHINLTKVSKRLKWNMDKFHYNPISLTPITREFFTHLQTLFIYSPEDNLFEDDERIIKREIQVCPYYLKDKEQRQIEEWTGLTCGNVLFDSVIDNWSKGTSVFNERIVGKTQLLFVIEDTDGEKFGYYLNNEVIKNFYDGIETDNKTFHFNLESNGRLLHPMKFEIKDVKSGGYCYFGKSNYRLIQIGNICLKKENNKDKSWCNQTENKFDYHGIEKALCGKVYDEYFTPKRILVIQME